MCMCVSVCVRVCEYVSAYVHICAYTLCTYVYMHVGRISILCICVCTYIFVQCVHKYVSMYIHTYIRACMLYPI